MVNQTVKKIAKNFVNLLYPIHCAICRKNLDPLDNFYVCTFCISMIKQNPKPYCESCGRSAQGAKTICRECRKAPFHFERARSACLYEGVLKELLHLFKYKRRISLSNILSRLMIDFIKEDGHFLDGVDIITFVPLANKRLRERGFNQSEVLALGLAKEFGIPMSDAIEKPRATKPQNELSRNERLVNLNGAFKMKNKIGLENLKILLVDDVMTTGATLNECSKTLLGSGAETVRCLTLARGL